MAASETAGAQPMIIKKYANRRLYNTQSSSYITLEDLAKMTREGVDFQVLDAKTGNDITHPILTQIIMDEEASGEQMLPVSFLRQLIGMYGNSMQSMMPPIWKPRWKTSAPIRQNCRKRSAPDSGGSAGSPMLCQAGRNQHGDVQAAASAFMPPLRAKPAAPLSRSRR